MIKFLTELHSRLVGLPDHTSLQARIFHEVSLIAMFSLSIGIVVNLIVGVPYVNLILAFTIGMVCAMYVNSRYYGRLKLSAIIFTCASVTMLLVNYFLNSGLKGPTLLLCLVSMVFTISVMPTRQHFIWVLLNTVIVASLITIEYSFPDLIKDTYTNRAGYYVDVLTTYLGVAICMGVVLSYLINGHNAEKQKALSATIALQAANESKTRLLSILSHDLRSPLNSIQGFLELLAGYNLAEDERREITQTLIKETKNTQVMLFNLLSWTKSQMDGGVKVNLKTLHLHEVVETCLRIQRASALEKMISIHNQTDPAIHVTADLDMLKLVIRNLLNNAIKFTHTGGEIKITSRTSGQVVNMDIIDNGVGISSDKQTTLFSEESASTYGTNNEKGVGLGLMLCKEFTELQGGCISFISNTSSQGSTFRIQLPFKLRTSTSTILKS